MLKWHFAYTINLLITILFWQKTGNFLYSVALAIYKAIKKFSEEKLSKEQDLESLKIRKKLWHLHTFYRITTGLLIYRLSIDTKYSTFLRLEQWSIILYVCVEQKHLNHLYFPGLLLSRIIKISVRCKQW